MTPSASEYDVETHWIWSVVAPKSFCIVEMATLTMLMSSTDMNMPTTSTSSGTSQFDRGPGWAGAAGATGAAGFAGAGAGSGRRAGAGGAGGASTECPFVPA